MTKELNKSALVSLSEIVVPEKRMRALRDTKELAQSMSSLGLLNPIVLTESKRLVAGLHRYTAAKALGWSHIPAILLDVSEIDAQIAEIDENLVRNELTVLERAEHLAKRKELYVAKYPETKQGTAGGKASGVSRKKKTDDSEESRTTVDSTLVHNAPKSFVADTASKTHVSESAIKQDIQIATSLSASVKEKLKGTPIEDSKTDLLKLARMPEEQQQRVVEKISSGEAKTVKEVSLSDARQKVEEQAKTTAERAIIKCCDALDFLASFDNGSIDLLLTDPPYATDVPDINAFARWVHVALKKLKPAGRAYICTGAYPKELRAYLNVIEEAGWLDKCQCLVWTYRNTIGPTPKNQYKNNWQNIFFLNNTSTTPLDCPVMVEQFSVQDINAPDGRQGDRYHAWQKPSELAERFVRHASKPGDLVVDPFACTGTFLLAAAKLGRRAIGCDISAENIKIAEKRGCVRE